MKPNQTSPVYSPPPPPSPPEPEPEPVRNKFGYNYDHTFTHTKETLPLISFPRNNRRVTVSWPVNICYQNDKIVPDRVIFELKQEPYCSKIEGEELGWSDPRRFRAYAPDPNRVIAQKIILELEGGPVAVRRKDGDGYDLKFNFNTPRDQPNIYVSLQGTGFISDDVDFTNGVDGEGFSPVFCILDQKRSEVTYHRMASRVFWEGAGLSSFLYHLDEDCAKGQDYIKNLCATMAKRDINAGWSARAAIFPFEDCDLREIYFTTQHHKTASELGPDGMWNHQLQTDEKKFLFALFSFGAQLTKGLTDRFFMKLMNMSNVLSSFSVYKYKNGLGNFQYNQSINFQEISSKKMDDGTYKITEHENFIDADHWTWSLRPSGKRVREE